ncbi:unnamed protein product [Albugo candida]|nr:unnamed protein product [Albugo candida]|eukprot:CCI39686.1 unnamed protein product [Albugo candida]
MEICPQKSDVKSPNSASGMKKTCKTALEINTENANDTVLIAAISENRSRELGIAMIDLSSPHELLLWNIIDSAHYVESISLLEALQPKEILVVETLQKQRVNGEIANRLANTMCKIIPLARKYFDNPSQCVKYFDSMSTFHVISGSNCAGKTTYMKSVAIITILAHMGCYVPAVAAFLPLRDRICTRFGTSDDMEENASTFKVEMTETAFILEKATKASLVLVDELGRGTASDEGCALAWSISENLIAKGIYTCFATHFRQLNELANVYINCKCYHLAASFSETNVRYFHTLNDGACPEYPKYGIQAAKMCGLPMQIIRDAEEIYDRLKSNQHSIKTSTSVSVGRVESRLLHHLLALIHAGLDKKALRVQLQSLKEANQENSIE